jgi:hypothetical protein
MKNANKCGNAKRENMKTADTLQQFRGVDSPQVHIGATTKG